MDLYLKETNCFVIVLRLYKLKPNIYWIILIGIYSQPIAIIIAENFKNRVEDEDIHIHENNMLAGAVRFQRLEKQLLTNVLIVVCIRVPANCKGFADAVETPDADNAQEVEALP